MIVDFFFPFDRKKFIRLVGTNFRKVGDASARFREEDHASKALDNICRANVMQVPLFSDFCIFVEQTGLAVTDEMS